MNKLLLAMAALLACGCRGVVPLQNAGHDQEAAGLLIESRIMTISGEKLEGRIDVNLEPEGNGSAQFYRLQIQSRQSAAFQVDPGSYRLSPPRSLFGSRQPLLTVRAEGTVYRLPFPRELSRRPPWRLKAGKITPVGVLEARISRSMVTQEPSLTLRFDDSPRTRRRLVESAIRTMMDTEALSRDSARAMSWARALQSSLTELMAETGQAPATLP